MSITVHIGEAKNLYDVDAGKKTVMGHTYIKVKLGQQGKQKTHRVKGTFHPVFDQTFSYSDWSEEETLSIAAWHWKGLGKNECIGLKNINQKDLAPAGLLQATLQLDAPPNQASLVAHAGVPATWGSVQVCIQDSEMAENYKSRQEELKKQEKAQREEEEEAARRLQERLKKQEEEREQGQKESVEKQMAALKAVAIEEQREKNKGRFSGSTLAATIARMGPAADTPSSARRMSQIFDNWNKRFAVLSNNTMTFYKTEGAATPEASLHLSQHSRISPLSRTSVGWEFSLQYRPGGRVFNFLCYDGHTGVGWVEHLSGVMEALGGKGIPIDGQGGQLLPPNGFKAAWPHGPVSQKLVAARGNRLIASAERQLPFLQTKERGGGRVVKVGELMIMDPNGAGVDFEAGTSAIYQTGNVYAKDGGTLFVETSSRRYFMRLTAGLVAQPLPSLPSSEEGAKGNRYPFSLWHSGDAGVGAVSGEEEKAGEKQEVAETKRGQREGQGDNRDNVNEAVASLFPGHKRVGSVGAGAAGGSQGDIQFEAARVLMFFCYSAKEREQWLNGIVAGGGGGLGAVRLERLKLPADDRPERRKSFLGGLLSKR